MRDAGKRRFKETRLIILCFLMGGWLFFQTSCTTTDGTLEKIKSALKTEEPAKGKRATTENKTVKREEPVKRVVSGQGEYVVHVLERGETPASLAKKFLGDPNKSWVIEDANEDVPFRAGRAISIPLKDENKAGLTADGYQVVPILCYHHFAKKCQSLLCAPVEVFKREMKYLKDHGYRVISLGELYDFLKYRHAIPKKSVAITIDDGYRSAYDTAYPILKRYGFRATLFVYTDFIGSSSSALTYDQLREMKADGFEVGSHTLSHADLTKKGKGESDGAYMARIKKELTMSKMILDKKLGQNTTYLSLPYGSYNNDVLNLCERVGYKMAVTVERGGNPFFAEPLLLKRDQVLKRDMKTFISRLKTFQKFSLR